jgi:hypothetical protein
MKLRFAFEPLTSAAPPTADLLAAAIVPPATCVQALFFHLLIQQAHQFFDESTMTIPKCLRFFRGGHATFPDKIVIRPKSTSPLVDSNPLQSRVSDNLPHEL